MIKVKICGITNLEDALASLFNQADAIGFVFYKKSPRYISPVIARNISRILPKKIIRVGVFVNEKEKVVKKIAEMCGLNMLQFHGLESPLYCQRFNGKKRKKGGYWPSPPFGKVSLGWRSPESGGIG
ncbi:MAG: phosphoribosylanthranilate isomerase [Verrucomicrobia bacterium]|nr:phosphoribosylanthranilate isomerase [Verrucomicrobiota bacterium]